MSETPEQIAAEAMSEAEVDRWEASAYFKKHSVYEAYAKAAVAALRGAGLLLEDGGETEWLDDYRPHFKAAEIKDRVDSQQYAESWIAGVVNSDDWEILHRRVGPWVAVDRGEQE